VGDALLIAFSLTRGRFPTGKRRVIHRYDLSMRRIRESKRRHFWSRLRHECL